MNKEAIIVKIGGSVVTEKHRSRPAIRRRLIEMIGQTIKKNWDSKKSHLILVHGAGSYGHLSAKKYKLEQGTKEHPEKLPRTLANKASDQFLNNALTQIFLSVGLPVAGINTSSNATNQAGKLSSLDPLPIETALKTGAIPLLHGDMVFDSIWGMSICSGDILVPFLAKKFRAAKIFYASDVDGIFTRDPHRYLDATLIRTLRLRELFSEKVALGRSHHIDVTAGFSGKFEVYRKETFPRLKTIGIFNGLAADNFSAIFSQRKFPGTLVLVKK